MRGGRERYEVVFWNPIILDTRWWRGRWTDKTETYCTTSELLTLAHETGAKTIIASRLWTVWTTTSV